jgi:ribosome-binding protein aMBF1 (putative translation factor)
MIPVTHTGQGRRPFADRQRPSFEAAFHASGMTQLELAQKVGTSESHVNRWVKGHIIPSRVYRPLIERALEAAIQWPETRRPK